MEFKLPDIGEGIHEGEITKWLVKVGEMVKVDQPMVEVMTDKATVEIPCPVSGVVEVLMVQEGQTIEVGKALLRIRENGKSIETKLAESPKVAHSTEQPEGVASIPLIPPPPLIKSPQAGEIIPFQVLATPATRRLARELGMDLKSVKGTGPAGRITKTDVQVAYEGQQAALVRPSHPAPIVSSPILAKPAVVRGAVEKIPLKGIRKKISEAMAYSKRTAAHFTYVEEVDMTEIVSLRNSVKAEAEKRGVKLTFLPFIIKAVIPALKEFPFLNSSLNDEAQEIELKGDYNIGIATDTPQGLIVPVIKAADQKTLWELSNEIALLAEKARSGKISLEELRAGTFTITNAGTIGGVFATPVINHPEVAILGVNAIRKRPVVKEDQIVIREMMFLSISIDHRVVDGADAARFMNRIKFFLSDPKRFVFA